MTNINPCNMYELGIKLAFNKVSDISSIKVNREMVQDDINRLTAELGKTNNKADDNNIKNCVKYLQRLLRITDNENSEFDLSWRLDGDSLPIAYPMQMTDFPLYKLKISNYMEIDKNQKLLSIDLTELADLIAFDYINRDLGEDHDSIEELLRECDIVKFYDCKILTDKFRADNDKMYLLSQSMRIGESEHVSQEHDETYDFFFSKKFMLDYEKSTYQEVVEYSCRYAATIVAASLIQKMYSSKIPFKLVSLSPVGISFIVGNENSASTIADDIVEQVSVKICGRKFLVDPVVSIF